MYVCASGLVYIYACVYTIYACVGVSICEEFNVFRYMRNFEQCNTTIVPIYLYLCAFATRPILPIQVTFNKNQSTFLNEVIKKKKISFVYIQFNI